MGYDKYGLDWDVSTHAGPPATGTAAPPSPAIRSGGGSGGQQPAQQPATTTEEDQPETQDDTPAQLTLVSACFVPDASTDFNKPCTVSADVDSGGAPCSALVTFKLWGRYDGQECDLGVSASGNAAGGRVQANIPLFYVEGYYDDVVVNLMDGKTVEYFCKVTAAGASEIQSDPLVMPRKPAPPVLRKRHYDDKACSKYPTRRATGGDGYLEGTPVFDLQNSLKTLEFTGVGVPDGDFGDATDTAVRDFQTAALDKKRKFKDANIETDVTFDGQADGEVGAKSRAEIDLWIRNKYRKPIEPLAHGHFDDNGVRAGKGRAGGEGHRPGSAVLTAQKDLAAVGAYDGKHDGWFWDKMKEAVIVFQEAAEKGELFINGVLSDIGEKLTGHEKGTLDDPTRRMLEKVIMKGGKVEGNNLAIDWDFIAEREGNLDYMYVPKNNGRTIDSSGPTIAAGFDLGQITAQGLKALGFSVSLESKLQPYVGHKGAEADEFVKKNPLTLSGAEISEINKKVQTTHGNSAASFYNEGITDENKMFIKIHAAIQTAFASVFFQYGHTPKFRGLLVGEKYCDAIKELMNFTSKTEEVQNPKTGETHHIMEFTERRCREARYMLAGIPDETEKSKSIQVIERKETEWEAAFGRRKKW